MVGARSVVQERVVHTLHVAVHVRSHGERRRCFTFLILILLVPFLSTRTLRLHPIHAYARIPLLVKVLRFGFLRGLDQFHESPSVFSSNGYDPHARVLGIRKLFVDTLLLGFTFLASDVFPMMGMGMGMGIVFVRFSGAIVPWPGSVDGFLDQHGFGLRLFRYLGLGLELGRWEGERRRWRSDGSAIVWRAHWATIRLLNCFRRVSGTGDMHTRILLRGGTWGGRCCKYGLMDRRIWE